MATLASSRTMTAAAALSAAASTASARPMPSYLSTPFSRYADLELIGEGTYGTVWRATDTVTKEFVAVKELRRAHSRSGLSVTTLREMRILQSLRHRHIVNLITVATDESAGSYDRVFLVFDYAPLDLATMIQRRRRLSLVNIKSIVYSLLLGAEYLHANFIMHRDLKLANILITHRGTVKIADFGLARTFSHPLQSVTPKTVTLWYRAPELLLGLTTYHSAVDIWAIGCILAELILNKPLLAGKNEMDQFELISRLLGSPNHNIWPNYDNLILSDKSHWLHTMNYYQYNNLQATFTNDIISATGVHLIGRMLTYDPSKRITARKALQHPFFKEEPLPQAHVDNIDEFDDHLHDDNDNDEHDDENDEENNQRDTDAHSGENMPTDGESASFNTGDSMDDDVDDDEELNYDDPAVTEEDNLTNEGIAERLDYTDDNDSDNDDKDFIREFDAKDSER